MQDITDHISPLAHRKHVRKQTVVYYQGEIPRSAHIIKHGLVKAYSITPAGEERIVALQGAGDIFPMPWAFGQASSTLFYYETLTDCELLSVTKADLTKVMSDNPKALQSAFDLVINNYTGLLLRVTALEQSRAVEKIAFTLYYLLFHYGKDGGKGMYDIQAKLTQPMIASLVGLTRETTVVTLNMLRRRGVVKYDRHTYSVHKEKLEKFLGEDSFKDIVATN